MVGHGTPQEDDWITGSQRVAGTGVKPDCTDMSLIDIIRVPLLHYVRLDNDSVSSNHAVSKTFVSTVFPSYNNIVSRIMSNADDIIHFRRKIETYIRSLATSKNPRHNRPTMTLMFAYVLRPISSSPTFLLLLRRHRKQAASGGVVAPR